jgi:hypothetical protein
MTSFRELWRKFKRSFDTFMEAFQTRNREHGGGLLRLGVLCFALSLITSEVFRASWSNGLIPNNLFPASVIIFYAIELTLGGICTAAFLKITGRTGLKFLVVAAIVVAFGISIWAIFNNAIT